MQQTIIPRPFDAMAFRARTIGTASTMPGLYEGQLRIPSLPSDFTMDLTGIHNRPPLNRNHFRYLVVEAFQHDKISLGVAIRHLFNAGFRGPQLCPEHAK